MEPWNWGHCLYIENGALFQRGRGSGYRGETGIPASKQKKVNDLFLFSALNHLLGYKQKEVLSTSPSDFGGFSPA